MQVDFLIVGQGLAGSLLAWEMLKRGKRVIVVDPGMENASTVAAGIINPVTGMRLVKTANAESLLQAAKQCYGELSEMFKRPFFSDKPMIRIFQTDSERTQAEKRTYNPRYRTYFGELISSGETIGEFNSPYGYIEQTRTGYLNNKALLACLKQFLLERNSYLSAYFDYDLKFSNTQVIWRGIAAAHVIFCEGYRIQDNPWFNWLPLQPAKGEILTLTYDKAMPEVIYNFGNWLLPLEMGKIRLGATFDHTFINDSPTSPGRMSLLDNLKTYHPALAQAEVCVHQAGVRPCTLDKNPFLGRHPCYKQIALFNGFGAKGSLQIPWYSQRFADFIINEAPLPVSCDIRRYESIHFSG